MSDAAKCTSSTAAAVGEHEHITHVNECHSTRSNMERQKQYVRTLISALFSPHCLSSSSVMSDSTYAVSSSRERPLRAVCAFIKEPSAERESPSRSLARSLARSPSKSTYMDGRGRPFRMRSTACSRGGRDPVTPPCTHTPVLRLNFSRDDDLTLLRRLFALRFGLHGWSRREWRSGPTRPRS